LLAVAGGGSLVSRQLRSRTETVASIVPESINIAKAIRKAGDTAPPAVVGRWTELSAASRPQSLALASDVDDLSDGNLVQLMNDMDQFDALPPTEAEPVIAVDSGDSL